MTYLAVCSRQIPPTDRLTHWDRRRRIHFRFFPCSCSITGVTAKPDYPRKMFFQRSGNAHTLHDAFFLIKCDISVLCCKLKSVGLHWTVGMRFCLISTHYKQSKGGVGKASDRLLNVYFVAKVTLWQSPSRGSTDFPGGSDGKESAYNVGGLGLIPRLWRSHGEGNGNPLQYSCLENPMDEESGGP